MSGTFLFALALAGAQAEPVGARLDRAEALLARNAAVEAKEILRPLLEEVSASDDQGALVRAQRATGWAHYLAGEYPAALEAYGRALELSRRLGESLFEAWSLFGIAQVQKARASYPEALEAAHGAIVLFEELGRDEDAGRGFVIVGSVQDLMGEYRSALSSYEEAKTRLERTRGQAYFRLLNEIGITHKNLGDYEEALEHYRLALEEQRRTGDRYGQAVTLLNTGVAYAELGRHERAIDLYEEALALARDLGEKRGQSIIFGNLAASWEALEDRPRAREYLLAQLSLAREIGNRVTEGWALKDLGVLSLDDDDLKAARGYLEAALALQRALGARAFQGAVLVPLSDLSLREGRTADARRQAEEALTIALETERLELVPKARLSLARAERADDAEAALRDLREGVAVIDGLRGRILTDPGKVGYLEDRQRVFHEMVDLLASTGRPTEALEAAEAARSRAFLDLLAGRLKVKPESAARLADIRAEEARLRAQSRRTSAEPSPGGEVSRMRAATEAALGRKLRSLQADERELASLVVAEPITFAEIVASARRLQATFVEYLVTEARLFAWVVGPDGAVHGTSVALERAALRKRVAELHRKLDELDAAALRDLRPVRTALSALYQSVLSPVAPHLPRDPSSLVYLIPHDALLLLPFATLVDPQGRYLAETHTLATAPSVAVLRYTAGKKRGLPFAGEGARVLALADPRLPEGALAPPLLGARAEVQKLTRRFAPERVTQLFGADASEANYKRLGPAQTLLHVAAHGLVYDERPWDSALLLSPGGGEDGWLKVSEVFGQELSADLVVLSGCSTGRGKLTGDGILGLARAFLYAGTPSVLVSQWDVSDVATAFLMDQFYEGLLKGMGKARALRRAQILAAKRYPHPALWAAFTLVGEPD